MSLFPSFLIFSSELIGLGTIVYGLVIVSRGRVNLGLGRNLAGLKVFWVGLFCVILGLALIRFNHAMVNTFPEGLGH
jgi:dipeptide/tripeptide permease